MIQRREINTRPSVIPQQLEAEPVVSGVISFNGRIGVVRPQTGDYTAAMVGADPKGSAQKVKDDLTAEIENIPAGPEGPAGPQGDPGPAGEKGKPGATFFPSVNEAGIISWENDNGLKNPNPVDIKGPQGPVGQNGKDATINGENAINIVQGNNIILEQAGDTLTISATSSSSLTAGPDMLIENDVINPRLPVRYKTAAEYAALTEEEKMQDVLYVVSNNPSPSEYNAEYVKKYENGNFKIRRCIDGYCEIVYGGSTQFSSDGGIDFLTMKKYSLDTGTIELPVLLSDKYSETITYEIHKVSDGSIYAIGDTFPISMENHIKNDLYMAEWSIVYSPPATAENIEVIYNVRITGKAGD